jgi:hypothetical protein
VKAEAPFAPTIQVASSPVLSKEIFANRWWFMLFQNLTNQLAVN